MNQVLGILVLVAMSPATASPQGELQVAELGRCALDSGEVIDPCQLGYRTFGELNDDRTNAILFPTWFTGTTEGLVPLIGPGGLIDPTGYFVITVDTFGNGVSSSPSTSHTQPGETFPTITIGDMVRAQHRLVTETLRLPSLHAVVGLSMGGMQAFEWAVTYPDFTDKIVPIIGSPRLAAYDIALWETYLRVLELYHVCQCEAAVAAQSGLNFLTLNSPDYHAQATPRDSVYAVLERGSGGGALTTAGAHDIASQLRAMIHHDVARGAGGSMDLAAKRITAEMFVIVATADHMVTPGPAVAFARSAGARVWEMDSACGHLAPWCMLGEVRTAIRDFLRDR